MVVLIESLYRSARDSDFAISATVNSTDTVAVADNLWGRALIQ